MFSTWPVVATWPAIPRSIGNLSRPTYTRLLRVRTELILKVDHQPSAVPNLFLVLLVQIAMLLQSGADVEDARVELVGLVVHQEETSTVCVD